MKEYDKMKECMVEIYHKYFWTSIKGDYLQVGTLNKLYGYYDFNGNVIVECIYDNITADYLFGKYILNQNRIEKLKTII